MFYYDYSLILLYFHVFFYIFKLQPTQMTPKQEILIFVISA